MKEGRSLDKAEANGGYIWIEKSFVIKILPHLSGLASRVYLYLVFNSPQGKKADPITRKGLSAATIGKGLKRDRRSITKALNELVGIGAIEKISEAGLSNRYRLLATCEENFTGQPSRVL